MPGMSVDFRVNTREYERGLRRWFGRASQDAQDAMDRTGERVVEYAQSIVPVDTSRLRTSIRYRVVRRGRRYTIEVGSNVNYAWDVEHGTDPHIIRPVRKKALYWPGAAHPVAVVHHPGTKPRPYLRPALAQAPRIWRVEARSIGRGR